MAVDTKAPGQAPPDLPSLLLDGRILYIGMPVSHLDRVPFLWFWGEVSFNIRNGDILLLHELTHFFTNSSFNA